MFSVLGESPEPISVSELTSQLRAMIENHFQQVLLYGELANVSINKASGHIYLSIKDPELPASESPVLSAVIWRNFAQQLDFCSPKRDVCHLLGIDERLSAAGELSAEDHPNAAAGSGGAGAASPAFGGTPPGLPPD